MFKPTGSVIEAAITTLNLEKAPLRVGATHNDRIGWERGHSIGDFIAQRRRKRRTGEKYLWRTGARQRFFFRGLPRLFSNPAGKVLICAKGALLASVSTRKVDVHPDRFRPLPL